MASDATKYADAKEIQHAAFGAPAERLAENRRTAERDWASYAPLVMHAVFDGEAMIGAGACAAAPGALALFGGAVAAGARGRGAYRALISAR